MQWREADLSDSWARRLGPERAMCGFRVRDVLTSGTKLVLGSDWPVAPFDPRLGMAWAALRARPGDDDAPRFEPDQCLTIEEALHGYTRAAAQAVGATDRGSLRPGSRADLTIYEGDPTTLSGGEMVDLPIVGCVVDGRLVHGMLTDGRTNSGAPPQN
jgi:predicted amidohydrolase YtcJ